MARRDGSPGAGQPDGAGAGEPGAGDPAGVEDPDGVGVGLPGVPGEPDGDGVGLLLRFGALDEGRGTGLWVRVLVGTGTGITGRDDGAGAGVAGGMIADDDAGLTTT